MYRFALDESDGTGKGYDRLYLDIDQDRDLTNDRVLPIEKAPPSRAWLNYAGIAQRACFHTVDIPLPCGAQGRRPLEMMPQLMIHEAGYKELCFITTQVHRGRYPPFRAEL